MMISYIILLWSRLNLLSLFSEYQKELIKSRVTKKAIIYFIYTQSKKGY